MRITHENQALAADRAVPNDFGESSRGDEAERAEVTPRPPLSGSLQDIRAAAAAVKVQIAPSASVQNAPSKLISSIIIPSAGPVPGSLHDIRNSLSVKEESQVLFQSAEVHSAPIPMQAV